MKRLLAIVLFALYGITSSGASLYFHYCCGKLKSVDFHSSESSGTCQHKSTGLKRVCCENEIISLRLDDTSKSDTFFELKAPSARYNQQFVFLLPSVPEFQDAIQKSNTLQIYLPPPSATPSIHIMNCVFRI